MLGKSSRCSGGALAQLRRARRVQACTPRDHKPRGDGDHERIRTQSFGGVQPNLSLGVIRDTAIPLPPLRTQIAIATKTEKLLALGRQLTSSVALANDRIEQSREVLAERCFHGGLVTSVSSSA